MYNIFNKSYQISASVSINPSFDLIKRTYQNTIQTIINYYQNRTFAVRSNHLLCRMITIGMIPISTDNDRFHEIAFNRSPYIAKHFNLTSPISYGTIFKETFYSNCNEILIYDDSDFNYKEVLSDWRNVSAVKVLDHPLSNTGFLLPSGNSGFIDNKEKENTTDLDIINLYSDSGLAIITINISLLLTQYKGFLLETMTNPNMSSELTIANFIHMFVLPNMLYSHTELVLLNRMMNLFYGAPMGESYRKYPFSIINYDSKLDGILNQSLKRLELSNFIYPSMLSNIPSIFNKSMLESLLVPDIAQTSQVWWALILSRLKIMKFLLDISNEKAIANNKAYINHFKIIIKNLNRNNVYNSLLSKDIYYEIENIFNEILMRY